MNPPLFNAAALALATLILLSWSARAADKRDGSGAGLLADNLSLAALDRAHEQGDGTIGELGDPSLILFEGNTTFTKAQLQEALSLNAGYLLAAHPQASLKPFLIVLRDKVLGGYQSAGFADAVVNASYDQSAKRLRVKIMEGKRYRAGEVRVTGVSKPIAAQIRQRLTQWPEPNTSPFVRMGESFATAASGTKQPTETLRIQTAVRDDTNTSDDPPKWELGEPAPMNPQALGQIEFVVKNALAEFGYLFPKLKIERAADRSIGRAILKVAVTETGVAGTLVEIEVSGNEKNSRAEVLKYIGLHSGMTISRKLFERVESKLRNSGRFMDWAIVPEPASITERGSGGVRLLIQVREYDRAPKLADALSPEQKALLACARWVANFKKRSEDLVIKYGSGKDSKVPGFLGSIIMSPRDGVLASLKMAEKPVPSALLMSKRTLAVYSPPTGSKLEIEDPDLAFQGVIHLEPNAAKDSTNRWNLMIGASFKHFRNSGKQPFTLIHSVAPVVLMSMADDYRCKLSGGKLIVSNANFCMTVNARSGRIEKLRADSENVVAEVQFVRGAFEEAARAVQQENATLSNCYTSGHALSSLLNFTASQALEWSVLSRPNGNNASAARALFALQKLTGNSLLEGIDQYFACGTSPDKFTVPMDDLDTALAQNNVAAVFSGFVFRYCEQLFPRYSWPWTLGRESVFILAGQGTYADAELSRLHESDQTGPIGSLAIAKLLSRFNPGGAKSFALRGILRLSAEDFQKDCALFLESGGGLSEAFAKFTDNLRSLPDDELHALIAVLPEHEARLLHDSADALRADPQRRAAICLAPVLDRYWNDWLRAKVLAELKKIAYPSPEASDPGRL